MKMQSLFFGLLPFAFLIGCASTPAPNAFSRSADPALPIEGQAVIAETGNVRVYGIDNQTVHANGIHYFVIPPGGHNIIMKCFMNGADTDEIAVYHNFEAGHYYEAAAVPDDAEKTVAINIEDSTTSEWWAENKKTFYARNALYTQYGNGKSNL